MSELSLPMYTHEKNMIQFSQHAVPNEVATSKAGCAQFDVIIRAHISVPGQKDTQTYEMERTYAEGYPNAVHGKVRRNEAIWPRFGKYFEDYKRNATTTIASGTPIEKWPQIDVVRVMQLKALGVHSVEALAGIADGAIQNLGMGGRDLVRKAQEYLSSAQNASAVTQLAAEKKSVEDRFAILEQKYTELADALVSLPNDVQSIIKEELAKRGKKAA